MKSSNATNILKIQITDIHTETHAYTNVQQASLVLLA